MVKIDAYLFGYRRLKIDPGDLSRLTSILLRASIPSTINNDGTLTVRERDFDKIKDLITGRIEFSYSEPLGAYGLWKRLPHKGAILVSLLVSILFVVFLSGLVWDIRVEGNDTLTDTEIILALADCGFEIGDRWGSVDLSETESAFLDKYLDIAWININRRGSVAYIKLLEKDNNKDDNIDLDNEPSNLVATVDCVIEEITVKRGVAVVKAGDVVRRGDVLVLGILPAEVGGGFCNAEATVIGRVNDSVSVEIEREYDKKTEINKKLYSCRVKIFKIFLNIFKRYGNLTNECVIIENEIKCSLFDKKTIPLSISTSYITEYVFEKAFYSDEELIGIASQRLTSLTLSRIEGADLIKIKTTGNFTDRGYCITNDILFLAEVSERMKLEIEN